MTCLGFLAREAYVGVLELHIFSLECNEVPVVSFEMSMSLA